MAKQPILVPNIKEYELTNNFNRGFNSNTTDGVISDNTFRDMLNFKIKEEGIVTKRPGCSNTGLDTLLELGKDYDASYFTVNSDAYATLRRVNIISHSTGDATQLFNNLITQKDAYNNHYSIVANFSMTDDNGVLADYNKYLVTDSPLTQREGWTNWFNAVGGKYSTGALSFSLEAILMQNSNAFQGPYVHFEYFYATISVEIENFSDPETTHYLYSDVNIRIDFTRYGVAGSDSVGPYQASLALGYNISNTLCDQKYLNIINYNDNRYFTTGAGLYKIDSAGTLTKISADTAYKPNAIEIQNVGFNLLATSPLTWYENSGTAVVIRGVFYTMDVGGGSYEPIITIPMNKAFRINIIRTNGTLIKPQYRPDNGDVSTTTNPWVDMVGSYGTGDSAHIFTCTEFNIYGKFEIRIQITGGVDFRGYFETSAPVIPEVGRVSSTSTLIEKSLYCAIIGSQLVLYGGHGYIFFSDYSNFTYFPNFNNIYAIDKTGDEVVVIKYFRQFYAVGTKEKWKRMTGTFGADNFGFYPLNDFVGCNNPHTVKQVQNNLLFTFDNAIYKLKQGYTGEGTENIERIDVPIQDKFDLSKATRGTTIGNDYILTMGNKILIYNFILDAFYPYELQLEDPNATDYYNYSPLFEKDMYGIDNYIVKTRPTIDSPTIKNIFLSYCDAEHNCSDDSLPYASYIKQPKLLHRTPTNNKKYKKLLVNSINEGDGVIPIYATIEVDGIVKLSPENYYVRIDDDDNYIYYERLDNPNVLLKSNMEIVSGAVIGELILGATKLGDQRSQTFMLDVNVKGKGVSATLADNYVNAEGVLVGTNTKPFSISDIGFIYKLKKPKAD